MTHNCRKLEKYLFRGRTGCIFDPWIGGPGDSSYPEGSEYVWQSGVGGQKCLVTGGFCQNLISPFPIAGDWLKVAQNQALLTTYPPLPYIFWKLWTCSFTWYHPIKDIPIQKIDGDAIPRPKKTVILGVRSPDYMVKSAIFKVWVISATSMHEITLYAIDMHKNRVITIF